MTLGHLILACTIWIPIAIWAVSIVHWTIMGEVDLITGAVGFLLAIGLGLMTFRPPVPSLAPFTYAAAVLTVVFYPAVRAAMDRRELKSIDVDGIGRAYQALAERPGNPLAVFRLARHLYEVGNIGHAVALADVALGQLPVQHFREEHRIVKRWKERGVPPETLRAIPCIECGHANLPGLTHCGGCGAPFLLDRARGKVLGRGMGPRLMAAWIALVAVLAGIPASTALPPLLSIVVILVLMAAAGTVVVLAFRGGRTVSA